LILDHRGREVRVYRPAVMSFSRDDKATFSEREFQEFRRRLAKRDPAGCFGWQSFYWFMLLFYIGRTVASLVTDSFSWPRTILRTLILIVFAGVWYLLQTRALPLPFRDFSREIQEELLKMRRCASCAFDLSGAPEDANGCRECPECGAAWKLS
jgi:hypothetical protein